MYMGYTLRSALSYIRRLFRGSDSAIPGGGEGDSETIDFNSLDCDITDRIEIRIEGDFPRLNAIPPDRTGWIHAGWIVQRLGSSSYVTFEDVNDAISYRDLHGDPDTDMIRPLYYQMELALTI